MSTMIQTRPFNPKINIEDISRIILGRLRLLEETLVKEDRPFYRRNNLTSHRVKNLFIQKLRDYIKILDNLPEKCTKEELDGISHTVREDIFNDIYTFYNDNYLNEELILIYVKETEAKWDVYGMLI